MAEAQPKPPLPTNTAQVIPPEHLRLSLIKGEHKWIFRWEAGGQAKLIERIAELARDPNIPFDWFDAAVVCKHIAQPHAAETTGTSCASSQSNGHSDDVQHQK